MGNTNATSLAVKPRAGLVGLTNFHNTCYMNSSLQCLAHTQPLVVHLLRRGEERGELAGEVTRLVSLIWQGKEASVRPRALKDMVDRMDKRYKGVRAQHDAFEFLLEFLVARLHKDLRPAAPPAGRRRSEKVRLFLPDRRELDRTDLDWPARLDEAARRAREARLDVKGRSVFTEQFHGQFAVRTFCGACDGVQLTFPLFLYLDLQVVDGDGGGACALERMLERHSEQAEARPWLCPHCCRGGEEAVPARVVTEVWRVPGVLMIRLGRVLREAGRRDTKVAAPVEYPRRGIRMARFARADSPQRREAEAEAARGDEDAYDLYAALLHRGSTPAKGHYVAEAKNQADGEFYTFNDSAVSRLLPSEQRARRVVSRDAYILFYQSRRLWREVELSTREGGGLSAAAAAVASAADAEAPEAAKQDEQQPQQQQQQDLMSQRPALPRPGKKMSRKALGRLCGCG